MKLNIKYFKIQYLAILLILLLPACHNHSENDGHTHGDKKATNEQSNKEVQGHEEAEPTITSLNDEQIRTVGVELGTIEQKQLTATIKVNGALRVPNNNKANVTSLYGGVVKTLHVQMGSFVRKGQIIATISNPQFIQLQEDYLNTVSKIVFAEQELTRQKELNAGNAGALKNLQNAEAELKTLKTRRSSLQQQIRLMGINPAAVNNGNLHSDLAVLSPIDGTVSNVIAKIGSYVDVSSPVAEIVDNGQLHLDLNVFERDLPMLRVGQTIHFRITNNAAEDYNAKIYSVGTSFENDSKTVPVHATVQGNKIGLIDGMNVTAIVSLNDVTTATVPNDAIVSTNGKDYIFVVTNKKPEEHHDEGEDAHQQEKTKEGTTTKGTKTNFEKIEVVKGVSELGYTAITPVIEIKGDVKIVTKGAFFVNAKMTNQGEGHEH